MDKITNIEQMDILGSGVLNAYKRMLISSCRRIKRMTLWLLILSTLGILFSFVLFYTKTDDTFTRQIYVVISYPFTLCFAIFIALVLKADAREKDLITNGVKCVNITDLPIEKGTKNDDYIFRVDNRTWHMSEDVYERIQFAKASDWFILVYYKNELCSLVQCATYTE